MIIDRFEGEFALCEHSDGTMVRLRRGELPQGAHEGAVLRWEKGGWILDAGAEQQRRRQIETLMDALFEEDDE